MGIFSEVGKIIMDEAGSENTRSGVPAEDGNSGRAYKEETPGIDGETVMDGEDMLKVVRINHIVPPPEVSSGRTGMLSSDNYAEDDLSFWETPQVTGEVSGKPARPEERTSRENPLKETSPASKENTISGDIVFPADATVHTNIIGNVKAKGTLTVKGTITGNVEACDVILCGFIYGSLKCRKLTLLPVTTGTAGKSTMSFVEGPVTTEALYTNLT